MIMNDVADLKQRLGSALADAKKSRDGSGGGPTMSDYVTHTEFAAAVAKIDGHFARVELRLDQAATKSDIESVRADLHKSSIDVRNWMIVTVVSLFMGFGGLFMAMSNALKPTSSATTSSPAPIIIQMPAPVAQPVK